MKKLFLLLPFLLWGCNKSIETIEPVVVEITEEIIEIDLSPFHRYVEPVEADHASAVSIASRYLGFHERQQRGELKLFIGIDPVHIDWCAAFVNSILHELDIPGSESVSEWPLTARSFLRWGQRVRTPELGDVIVFPRGREAWQGHVGFYVDTVYINGRRFYQILGGNQSDAVTIELFPARSAISIRRYNKK